jgi:hypothetical protein
MNVQWQVTGEKDCQNIEEDRGGDSAKGIQYWAFAGVPILISVPTRHS